MAYDMKGAGSRVPLTFFYFCCLKTIQNHSLTAKMRFAHSLSLYLICIVVEVNMDMADYGSRRSQQPENVNFEPNIRGLKSDIFD